MQPQVTAFFHEPTFTVSYVVSDPDTSQCAVVDSVLDYDASAGRTSTNAADEIIDFIRTQNLSVDWILETHVHADHLSAGSYLRDRLGGKIAVGSKITTVQETFGEIFNAGDEFARDGRQFDTLFDDGDTFGIGSLIGKAMHTPGHTPACMSYVIGNTVFVGDTLFMPDYGTARADFPGGDAGQLFRSIERLFELPEETRVFLCHDYKAPGRDEYCWETTIGEEKATNIHVRTEVTEADFVAMRTERDKSLNMPRLIIPSIQVNMRAGAFPPPESNGVSYLKVPLNAL